jgi:hypothetical protein
MRLAIAASALILLAGCESMVAPRYSVTGDNNVAIKALGVTGVGVGEFTGPGAFDSNCRLLGPLQTADGLTHTQYIRKAFEEEFKIGGIYAATSPSVVLTGHVTQLEFSSTRGVTGGAWTIALTLTSSNGRKMTATESYEFASGFAAPTACKQTAEAFAPAVQNLVGKFARSAEFAGLVRSSAQLSGKERVDAAFWESLRASSDPADFRAYLEQFPDGMHAAAARERLAALTAQAAVRQSAASSSARRLPQVGDTWTYRLTERTSSRQQRKYDVRVITASSADVTERYSIEDGRSGDAKHTGGPYLVGMGIAVFSPYLDAFQNLIAQPELSSVRTTDPVCHGSMYCQASARVVGRQTITVPAGTFDTIHVRVEHEWGRSNTTGAAWPGRRELDVWYAPSAKRAVKFSSRPKSGTMPFEGDFDLELTSFRLN